MTDEGERQAAIDRFELVKDEKESSFYTYYSLQSFLKGSRDSELTPVKGEILVCNLNQCAYYETVDISAHGIVMFSSGHGVGLSGMDILIVRKDLIESHLPTCPDMMDYKRMMTAKSVINTPFTLVPLMILHQLEYYHSLGYTLNKTK